MSRWPEEDTATTTSPKHAALWNDGEVIRDKYTTTEGHYIMMLGNLKSGLMISNFCEKRKIVQYHIISYTFTVDCTITIFVCKI